MLVISLQRNKCIGCNYCVEMAPEQFRMSKKDGKSVLLHAVEKKGFHTLKTPDENVLEQVENAVKACPVKIYKCKAGLRTNYQEFNDFSILFFKKFLSLINSLIFSNKDSRLFQNLSYFLL